MQVNFQKTTQALRLGAGYFVILLLIASSVNSQLQYAILPFLKSHKYIPYMLPKDDLGQLKELAYPLYSFIEEVNQYPEDTNFYFAPCFKDSGNTGLWWWYLYLLARYLCYPRKVFAIHPVLYNNYLEEYNGDSREYLGKYIGEARRYSDLEWIQSRGIKYVILLRNNRVSILPIDTEIVL